MRARRHAGVQGDPSRVAAHHFRHDDPAVRRCGGEQPVDALRAEVDGAVEAECRRCLFQIVVDCLGYADQTQPSLVQVAGYHQRSVAADRDQRIDFMLREAAKQLLGPVHLDPGAVMLSHRVSDWVATIGGADDRAAVVDDAANTVARQLDQPSLGILVREQQAVVAVADPDHIPTAVSCSQGSRADDGVESRRVTATGAQSDPIDGGLHEVNPTSAKHPPTAGFCPAMPAPTVRTRGPSQFERAWRQLAILAVPPWGFIAMLGKDSNVAKVLSRQDRGQPVPRLDELINPSTALSHNHSGLSKHPLTASPTTRADHRSTQKVRIRS